MNERFENPVSFTLEEFDEYNYKTGIYQGEFLSADVIEGTWWKPDGTLRSSIRWTRN